ncbi:MAG: response regulator [Beijerinckiaceae bacterium]|nr:response regulator [Beijerinckiaceae bacterium]
MNRILVVEDEFFVSMEIEAALNGAGHLVIGVATSADEAVAFAASALPDLILMDIRLHGKKDGVEAAIEIRQRLGIRSLFVSAHMDANTRERAKSADPVGWLLKPFSSQRLLDAVRSALEK